MGDIKKFNMSAVEKNRIWLIIGGRNTGKSVLLEDILFNISKNLDLCCLMCPTLPTRKQMLNHMPSMFIHDRYDYDMAQSFFDVAEEMTNKNKTRYLGLIIDDCVFDKKIMNTETQRALHLNGRHINTSLFVTTQYCMTTPAVIRGNIDYVIALKEPNKNIRKKLYEYYFGIFPNFKAFENLFQRITNNYGCLVFDRTQPTNSLANCVFHYKATYPVPEFKLCKPIYFYLESVLKRKSNHQK
jgi:hypothetical protein